MKFFPRLRAGDGLFRRLPLRFGIGAACLIGTLLSPAVVAAPADLVDAKLPSYKAQPVKVDKNRGYVMADGSVQIVGCDDMSGILSRLNTIFQQSHAGVKFKMELQGNGPAIPGITYDVSAFAPTCGGATVLQLLPYEKIMGSKAEPVAAFAIKVAHASLNPQAKLAPLGIVVNKSNPLASLTQEQVTSIFGYGAPGGDITGWSQLGLSGPLSGQAIHPTGLFEDAYNRPEDLGMGEYMMYLKMGQFPGYPFSPKYERMKRYTEVVDRVAGDPLAIGMVALNKVNNNPNVKVVPLVGADGKLTSGSEADIVAGRYPYDRYLYIYVRRPVGDPFDPFVKDYLKLVLSKEGQQAVAQDSKGYLPLSAAEVGEELAKIEGANDWKPRIVQGPKLNYPFPSPQP